MLWSILFIFCVLAPEGMNAIVFGGDKGGEVRSLLLARKDISSEVYFLFLSYILNISFEENDICYNIVVNLSYIRCEMTPTSVGGEQ